MSRNMNIKKYRVSKVPLPDGYIQIKSFIIYRGIPRQPPITKCDNNRTIESSTFLTGHSGRCSLYVTKHLNNPLDCESTNL